MNAREGPGWTCFPGGVHGRLESARESGHELGVEQDAPDLAPRPTPQQEIEALRRGDRDTLQAFYEAYAPTVMAWAIRLGGPQLDPETLTRRAFARALRRLHRADCAMGLAGWLFKNLQTELKRARWRSLLARLFGGRPVEVAPQGAGEALAMRRRSRVQEALGRLSTNAREVVVLVELEGRSIDQAAALLGITPQAVLGRLAASRPRLERALEQAGIRDLQPRGGRVFRLPRRGR